MDFFRRKKKKGPKILKYGLAVQTGSLDPRTVQDNTTALVLRQVFETPMTVTEDGGDPQPLLLAEPPQSRIEDDGREVWTASVRDDIIFSDGTLLTASLLAKALASNDVGGQSMSVAARGDRIVITLERSNPLFPHTLAAPYSGVYLETEKGLLGTGPFLLTSRDDPAVIRLVKNERFREEVSLDEIHFIHFDPDAEGRPTRLLEGIRSGDVHITNGLPRDEVANLFGIVKSIQPGNSTAILHFNSRRITDPRLRRALALAIDRDALARRSYENPLAFSASSLLPPMFGSPADGVRESLRSARAEIEAAEQTLPTVMTLLEVWAPRQYLPHPRRVSETVAEQLGRLGVEVEIIPTKNFDDFYDKCRRYDYDMALAGWISDTPHSADFLEANLASSSIPEMGKAPGVRFNLSGFRDDEVDSALANLKRGEKSALEIIRKRLGESRPLLPILYGPSVVVHQPSVRGYSHEAVDSYRLWEIDVS